MRIWVIDAFTDRPFAGNPAGVCLLDTTTWPDRAWMRQLAAELHLETAFAHPLPADADADWALRWFTPTAESNLCGHATLATAHALHHDRGTPGTVRFASRFGVLIAHARHDGAITLDFPAAPPHQGTGPRRPGRSARRHAPGHLPHRRPRRPARRPGQPGRHPRHHPRPGRPGPPDPPRRHPRDHRHRPSRGPRPRLRLRLPLLRTRRWHPRGPGHRQRPHRPGALLVAPPGPRPPHRAAGVHPHRPGRHRRPRRPRPPHRPRRHRPRRRPAPPCWITPGGAGRSHRLEPSGQLRSFVHAFLSEQAIPVVADPRSEPTGGGWPGSDGSGLGRRPVAIAADLAVLAR
jgi:Phenazine biosynthesis-like protein